MPRYDQPVSDEWDDTDLLKVWDDCVAEYKKYHSIAVNGGTLDQNGAAAHIKDIPPEDEYQPEEPESTGHDTAAQGLEDEAVNTNPVKPHETQGTVSSTPAVQTLPLPPNMTEHTKALALSWYYAGYYAGVAEGYAKAWAEGEQAR